MLICEVTSQNKLFCIKENILNVVNSQRIKDKVFDALRLKPNVSYSDEIL